MHDKVTGGVVLRGFSGFNWRRWLRQTGGAMAFAAAFGVAGTGLLLGDDSPRSSKQKAESQPAAKAEAKSPAVAPALKIRPAIRIVPAVRPASAQPATPVAPAAPPAEAAAEAGADAVVVTTTGETNGTVKVVAKPQATFGAVLGGIARSLGLGSGESPAVIITEAVAGEPAMNTAAIDAVATHEFAQDIKVQSVDGSMRLQTIAVDGDGRLLGLVAAPRGYGSTVSGSRAEIHVFTPAGKPDGVWNVDFHGQSINAGPDGSVFIAGDGKLAKFSKDGKLLKQIEMPHIREILKDKDGLRKGAEAQIAQQRESRKQFLEQYRSQLERLTKKPEEERSKSEKAQIKNYEAVIKSFEAQNDANEESVERIVQSIVGRVRVINSVAVSDEDIFIVCGQLTGYGYSVWRMDLNFENPKQILTGIAGCCGQMDVQVSGLDILVAENTKHSFARYDRDGKPLGRSGSRGQENLAGCFGGCCNPMNLRATSNGDVYTAESEGIVKRFGPDGKALAVVGRVKLTGGCKNVAVGASTDGKQIYFLDQPGSRIIVMNEKKAAKPDSASTN
ncbi:MAG TPA: hypothetical protein PLV92_04260 [Pirellulaceae bacterium]|nr:hypothetical protein [Pirellulaceae bacterium]